jgi:hypothetical protein
MADTEDRGVLLLGQLEHAVGDKGHRNYYATEPGDIDWEHLVSLRLAVRGRTIPGGLQNYHVSVPGVAMLRALYPRRYSRELKGVAIPDPITKAESETPT